MESLDSKAPIAACFIALWERPEPVDRGEYRILRHCAGYEVPCPKNFTKCIPPPSCPVGRDVMRFSVPGYVGLLAFERSEGKPSHNYIYDASRDDPDDALESVSDETELNSFRCSCASASASGPSLVPNNEQLQQSQLPPQHSLFPPVGAFFTTVGILIKSTTSGLEQPWRHSSGLLRVLDEYLTPPNKPLELPLLMYWERYGMESPPRIPLLPAFPPGRSKHQGFSSNYTDQSMEEVAENQQAKMMELLDAFGPLVFPLHRAALTSRRILFSTRGSPEKCSEFASVLDRISSLPRTFSEGKVTTHLPKVVSPLIPLIKKNAPRRHLYDRDLDYDDVPELLTGSKESTSKETYSDEKDRNTPSSVDWVGWTYDLGLVTEAACFDLHVELPEDTDFLEQKNRPTICCIRGSERVLVEATQRDMRQYNTLLKTIGFLEEHTTRRDLFRLISQQNRNATCTALEYVRSKDTDLSATPRSLIEESTGDTANDPSVAEIEDDIDMFLLANELPWVGFQYDEFVTRRASETHYLSRNPRNIRAQDLSQGILEKRVAAYFKSMTERILQVLGKRVIGCETSPQISMDENDTDASDNDNDDDADDWTIVVPLEDIASAGLDTSSQADRLWVEEFMQFFFNREATCV